MWILVALLSGMLVMVPSVGQARSSVPIVNVEDQALAREDGKVLTADQVKRAIILAGSSKKKLMWNISEEGDGRLKGKLVVRGKHTAIVDILYSATRLSIRYRDSTNLNYEKDRDGRDMIHPNYNRWVNDLLRAILSEVQRI